MRFFAKQATYCIAMLFLVFAACTGEDESSTKKKLEVILQDDLLAVIEDVAEDKLIEKPFYKILSYKEYTDGVYSRKAVAEFYFFRDVRVKVVRKYRYHVTRRMWERYFNEYRFFTDTTVPDSN